MYYVEAQSDGMIVKGVQCFPTQWDGKMKVDFGMKINGTRGQQKYRDMFIPMLC